MIFRSKSALYFILLVCAGMYISIDTIAQPSKHLGEGANLYFNAHEVAFFDSLFQHSLTRSPLDTFRVAFITEDRNQPVIPKNEFFDTYINPYIDRGEVPKFSTKGLTDDEKEMYGDFDVIIRTHGAGFDKRTVKALKKLDESEPRFK